MIIRIFYDDNANLNEVKTIKNFSKWQNHETYVIYQTTPTVWKLTNGQSNIMIRLYFSDELVDIIGFNQLYHVFQSKGLIQC